MTFSELLHASAVALAILLASLGLGGWILQKLRIEELGAGWLWLAATCGLGALSLSTLLIGMAGLLYRALFGLLLIPLAIFGVVLLATRAAPGWSDGRRWLAWSGSGLSFRVCAYLLLFVSAGSVLWIVLTHALMPPHEWDEVAYHLALAKLYVQAHRIVYVPFMVSSNWPMNNEMLFSIALVLGSDVAPHLLMLGMGVLTALGLLIVARRYFDDRVGIVAVALFLTVPLVKRLAGTGLIDIAPGLYVLAALVTFERWRQERRPVWLALSGACCGFAAGSKLMGGGFPLLLGLKLLVDELRQRPLRISAVLGHSALFGLVGLLMAGPWYARSVLFTGNPIWPFAYPFFGGRNWDTLGDEYHLNLLLKTWTPEISRTPVGLLQSFVYLLTRPTAMGGFSGGIGIALPVGALCASVLLRRAPHFLRTSLFICAGFYLLWFAFVSLQLRYLLPIVPLLALATAYLVVWLYARVRPRLWQWALLAGLLLVVFREWPWAYAPERELLVARLPYLRGQISREAWLETQIDSLPLFRYANSNLPAGARVLLLPYENRAYYLDRAYVWGNPISQRLIRFERFHSAAELAAELRRMGITHVIDDPAWIYEGIRYWQHDRALMLGLQQECGQLLYRRGEAVVYALAECKIAREHSTPSAAPQGEEGH